MQRNYDGMVNCNRIVENRVNPYEYTFHGDEVNGIDNDLSSGLGNMADTTFALLGIGAGIFYTVYEFVELFSS